MERQLADGLGGINIANSFAYTSHRMRHGFSLRDSSTWPWLFQSLKSCATKS
jgi:hypothetical protein